MLAFVGLLVLEISLSLAWPRDVPRLAFLPKPNAQYWDDGCNDHSRTYERSGPFWFAAETSTLALCRPR